MTAKQELRELIDRLTDDEAAELLDEVRWLLQDEEVLTEQEKAKLLEAHADVERGHFVRAGTTRPYVPDCQLVR